MTHLPAPPDAWRSEAFPEDLADDADTLPARGPWRSLLLGVLPLALATASAVLALWPQN